MRRAARYVSVALLVTVAGCGGLKRRKICSALDQGFVFVSKAPRQGSTTKVAEKKEKASTDLKADRLARAWSGVRGRRQQGIARQCVARFAEKYPNAGYELFEIVTGGDDELAAADAAAVRDLLRHAPEAPGDVPFYLHVADHSLTVAEYTGDDVAKHRAAQLAKEAFLLARASNLVDRAPEVEYQTLWGLAHAAQDIGQTLEAVEYWRQLLEHELTGEEPVRRIVQGLRRIGRTGPIGAFCADLGARGRTEQALACLSVARGDLQPWQKEEVVRRTLSSAIKVKPSTVANLGVLVPELGWLGDAVSSCGSDGALEEDSSATPRDVVGGVDTAEGDATVVERTAGIDIEADGADQLGDRADVYAVLARSTEEPLRRACYLSFSVSDCVGALRTKGTCTQADSLARYAEIASVGALESLVDSLYAETDGGTVYEEIDNAIELNEADAEPLFLFHAVIAARFSSAAGPPASCRLDPKHHQCALASLAPRVLNREVVMAVSAPEPGESACDVACVSASPSEEPESLTLWRVETPASRSAQHEWEQNRIRVGLETSLPVMRVTYELRHRLNGRPHVLRLSSARSSTGFAVEFNGKRGFCDYRVGVRLLLESGTSRRLSYDSLCDAGPPEQSR